MLEAFSKIVPKWNLKYNALQNIWQQVARGAEDRTYSNNLPNIYCTKIKTFEHTFSSNHLLLPLFWLPLIQKAHNIIKWPSPGERTNAILFEWLVILFIYPFLYIRVWTFPTTSADDKVVFSNTELHLHNNISHMCPKQANNPLRWLNDTLML